MNFWDKYKDEGAPVASPESEFDKAVTKPEVQRSFEDGGEFPHSRRRPSYMEPISDSEFASPLMRTIFDLLPKPRW